MDELADFYRRIGAALWYIQHLESVLAQFLTMKEIHELRCAGRRPTEEAAWKLLADHRKLTVGPLIDACKRRRIIKRDDAARYEALRTERHWLVHRSLVDNGDDLYLEAARLAVFARITAIEDEAHQLRDSVAESFSIWAAAHGVDVKAAEEVALGNIRRLKGQQ